MALRRPLAASLTVLAIVLAVAAPARGAPGDLDPTFGTHGKVEERPAIGSHANGVDLAIQPDGKLVAAGAQAVVRFLPGGAPDPAFGNSGRVALPEFIDVSAVKLQPDGAIVVAGVAQAGIGVARLLEDGRLDPGFSGDGMVIPGLTIRYRTTTSLALQPDGRIVVGGSLGEGGIALARLDTGGSLDPSFSEDGIQRDFVGQGRDLSDLEVQPDGRILAVGSGLTVVRYRPDGSFDDSFGTGGLASTGSGDPRTVGTSSVAIQPDGRIVVAGAVGVSRGGDIARYLPDGQLDPSFDADGRSSTAPGGVYLPLVDIAVQPDGKIVAVSHDHVNNTFVTYRFGADGSLDAGFSGDGFVRTVFDSGPTVPGAVALQPDGRIVTAGSHTVGGPVGILRFHAFVFLARHVVHPGPPDADADEILDPDDPCPELFLQRPGCPLQPRWISMERRATPSGRQFLAGSLDSVVPECSDTRRIKLLRRRGGGWRKDGSAETTQRKFRFDAPLRPGSYRARVREEIKPLVGVCARDGTITVRIKRRG